MKNTKDFEKFLQWVYDEDKTNNPMPSMKATKLLEDMKELIAKYSEKE